MQPTDLGPLADHPLRFVEEVHSTPSTADVLSVIFTIDIATTIRLLRLASIVENNDCFSTEFYDWRGEWYGESHEDLADMTAEEIAAIDTEDVPSVECECISVSASGFWLTAEVKYSDEHLRSEEIKLSVLVDHFKPLALQHLDELAQLHAALPAPFLGLPAGTAFEVARAEIETVILAVAKADAGAPQPAKQRHTFMLVVETELVAEAARLVLDRFLKIGLEEAEASVEKCEGGDPLAAAAANIIVTGPYFQGSRKA